jgi:tripartite-type tricarboxylate transporter receptor subunit TctC
VNTLNAALREILAIPEVKARYADLGVVAKASSPEELRARLQADIGKWAAVIERAGIPKQ